VQTCGSDPKQRQTIAEAQANSTRMGANSDAKRNIQIVLNHFEQKTVLDALVHERNRLPIYLQSLNETITVLDELIARIRDAKHSKAP
jgi:cell fate (sporulation/competence/biofilm development) regulator YlbF (YheA/YmcA/DUF963 family)